MPANVRAIRQILDHSSNSLLTFRFQVRRRRSSGMFNMFKCRYSTALAYWPGFMLNSSATCFSRSHTFSGTL